MKPTIQTFSGIMFDFIEPTLDMIDIVDIAHALANTSRYNGHTQTFYSVAQHSTIISACLPDIGRLRLAGLLHDAAEAYTGDMVSPLKRLCPDFKVVEKRIEALIAEKFGVDINDPRIKELDMRILINEKRDLFRRSDNVWAVENEYHPLQCGTILPYSPALAKSMFLDMFNSLD